MADPVLSLRDFRVTFKTPNGIVQAVRGIDLDVAPGEVVGVVGESGSGKSVTFLGPLGLLPKSAMIDRFGQGRRRPSWSALTSKQLSSVRGKKMAMIFQDPLSALNPVHGSAIQIVEMIQSHEDISRRRPQRRPSSCSTSSASRSPSSAPGSTRTSSRAACASA